MNTLKILWFAVQMLSTLALVAGIVEWVRAGAKFPRWVHTLAAALSVCGVITPLICVLNGKTSAGFTLACLLVPGTAVYIGWLWLGGPLLAETRRPAGPPV